jgi:hypothetical protein
MASADKTYINKEEYILVKQWWLKTRKKQKRELGSEIWMYPFQWLTHETYENGFDKPTVHYNFDPSESDLDIQNVGEDSTLWNTSTKTNFWIAKNCPFDFIQKQIKEKLSEEWYQEIPDELKPLSLIDKMTFNSPDYVIQITGKDSYLYFWEDCDEEYEKIIDRFLVYGTTFLYKIIHDFKNNQFSGKKFPYKVIFQYCGLNFEFNKGRMFYLSDKGKKKEVHIPFFRFENLKFPKFIHSWDIKDYSKWDKNKIILSFDDKVYDMSCYREESSKRRLLMELPDYIREQLKE